jgi:hypothetical protein
MLADGLIDCEILALGLMLELGLRLRLALADGLIL